MWFGAVRTVASDHNGLPLLELELQVALVVEVQAVFVVSQSEFYLLSPPLHPHTPHLKNPIQGHHV